MYKCKQCDKIYETPQKLGGHMIKMIKCGSHLKPSNSSIKIKSEWKIYNGKYKCPNCGSEFSKKGICSHIWRNHTEEGRLHRYGRKKGSIAWNKGLTKETDIRVKKTGEIYSKRIKDGIISASFKGKKHKKETIDKLKLNAGGLRRGAGRGKSGWYKGYWCDSTWELAWVIYNLENGIKFKRNKKGFKYLYKSKKHILK